MGMRMRMRMRVGVVWEGCGGRGGGMRESVVLILCSFSSFS
jgi:hypothetical protein